MLTDIDDITSDITEWLRETFPDRTPASVWQKLEEELGELRERPTDAWEWADVLILIFDLMDLYGIDPVKAIHWKMETNRKREWEIVDGVLKHK